MAGIAECLGLHFRENLKDLAITGTLTTRKDDRESVNFLYQRPGKHNSNWIARLQTKGGQSLHGEGFQQRGKILHRDLEGTRMLG